MTFEDLLSPAAVAVDAKAANRPAALQQLAALMARVTGATPASVKAALASREALGTTGFGGGCAIPHGRLAGLPAMVGGVLRLAQPVEWNAPDGQPVDLLFVLLGPEAPNPAYLPAHQPNHLPAPVPDHLANHLKALARISRVLRDKPFVAKLRGARDAGALFALLADAPGPKLRAVSTAA